MDRVLKSLVIGSFLALGLGAATVGCDNEIKREESVRVKDNGTVERKSDVVRETPDGGVVREQSKTVEK